MFVEVSRAAGTVSQHPGPSGCLICPLHKGLARKSIGPRHPIIRSHRRHRDTVIWEHESQAPLFSDSRRHKYQASRPDCRGWRWLSEIEVGGPSRPKPAHTRSMQHPISAASA
jgi:hypothetical protein